jgi:S-adenosylmethionine:tRNA ribosyltransferase-isomerase
MQPSDYHYELPAELIATRPAARRDASRLLHLPHGGAPPAHERFDRLPDLLQPGDCLVLNESRVIPARLRARRPSGGAAELLLTEPRGDGVWEALVRPARKLPPGLWLDLAGGGRAEILAGGSEKTRLVRLDLPGDWLEYLHLHGQIPLPPYIVHQRRELGEAAEPDAEDKERYQTVYARPPGSSAAPTAGLHFTPELLERIRARGIEIRRVTLHVGLGTFAPLTEAELSSGRLHRERYEIGEADARAIDAARLDPARRIVAVGTTSVRALESCMARHGAIVPVRESTDIFIRPGFVFAATGALITNFHLPESSLLMLVAAFAGRERVLDAYREAVRQRYRFFSYGDAMFVE